MGVKVAGTSKQGKPFERPKSIDRWRATSHDREALVQLAVIYGGTVVPWVEPRADPGQHQVELDTNELRIVLPPDPLGGSPVYECWSGGGCERRCDGVTCTRVVQGVDGLEPVDVACVCVAEGAMACEPHTRLSVMLPDVRFGGVWMLDTKGWEAAAELPGMVELLAETQAGGLTQGLLRLEHRRKVVAGQTRHYPVPRLALTDSMDALVAGRARYGDLEPASDVAALPVATGSDDEVVDAEVVVCLADVLPVGCSEAKALVTARRAAADLGVDEPRSLEELTDPKVIALTLDRLDVS